MNIMVANVVTVLRISLGDYDFESSTYLKNFENKLLWATWLAIVLITSIIMLNFVIAEASNIYASVVDRLGAESNKAKAMLVREAELVVPFRFKDDQWFPKYIIIR